MHQPPTLLDTTPHDPLDAIAAVMAQVLRDVAQALRHGAETLEVTTRMISLSQNNGKVAAPSDAAARVGTAQWHQGPDILSVPVRPRKPLLRQEQLPDLLTVKEAAVYTCRSPATIRRWAKRDPHFPKLQEGLHGHILVYRDEFINWLKAKNHATKNNA
jgi:Helix-turn-helix domain